MKMHASDRAEEAQDAWDTIRTGLRIIRKHLRPYRRTIFGLTLFSVVSAVVNAAIPFATGRFIDALIALSREQALLMLSMWAALSLVTVLVDGWIDFVRVRLMTDAFADYVQRGLAHMLTLPIAFHKKQKLGDLNQQIVQGASALEGFIGQQAIELLPQFLAIVIALAFSFVINPLLGTILVVGVSLYLVILWRVTPQTVTVGNASYNAWRDGFGLAWDIGQNIIEVKQAVAEEFEKQRLKKRLVDEAAGLNVQLHRLFQKLFIGQRLLIATTQFAIFFVAVSFVISGKLSIGELVMFNAYAAMLYGPFVQLGRQWQNIQRGMIALREGEDLFAEESEVYHPRNEVSLNPLRGDVTFENVSFRYDEGQEDILKGVTFRVKAGQTVALVGRSGVGKTTLINLISGYMYPTDGRVLVDGHDVRALDLIALRNQIAVVSQEPVLFNETIFANIAYPSNNDDIDRDAIYKVARLACVDEFVRSFPDGYDQRVGRRGIKLSTGQKQRISIARAILRAPKLLMLDEPTSALDALTEESLIRESLAELMRERTTFVIAHRMSTVRNADLILVLDRGRIVEQGTHAQLMAIKGGIYHAFQKLQQLPDDEDDGDIE